MRPNLEKSVLILSHLPAISPHMSRKTPGYMQWLLSKHLKSKRETLCWPGYMIFIAVTQISKGCWKWEPNSDQGKRPVCYWLVTERLAESEKHIDSFQEPHTQSPQETNHKLSKSSEETRLAAGDWSKCEPGEAMTEAEQVCSEESLTQPSKPKLGVQEKANTARQILNSNSRKVVFLSCSESIANSAPLFWYC